MLAAHARLRSGERCAIDGDDEFLWYLARDPESHCSIPVKYRDGTWGFDTIFDPADSGCFASTAGGDAVPTGETTWQYVDDESDVDRALTVT